MDKHDKACKEKLSSASMQQSIRSFCIIANNNNQALIRLTKRKITAKLAECFALDDLSFSSVEGDGFRAMIQDVLKVDRQLNSNVSVNDILPDPTTVSKIFPL
jgi:hypothetical protein